MRLSKNEAKDKSASQPNDLKRTPLATITNTLRPILLKHPKEAAALIKDLLNLPKQTLQKFSELLSGCDDDKLAQFPIGRKDLNIQEKFDLFNKIASKATNFRQRFSLRNCNRSSLRNGGNLLNSVREILKETEKSGTNPQSYFNLASDAFKNSPNSLFLFDPKKPLEKNIEKMISNSLGIDDETDDEDESSNDSSDEQTYN